MFGISILGALQEPQVAGLRLRAWRQGSCVALLCATAALAGCGQPGPLYLPAAPAATMQAPARPSSSPGSAPAMPGKPASAPGLG